MARKKRFFKLDHCHHVMLRGNGGQNIFLDDVDRSKFALLLQAASEKHAFHIHAFCFMSNHVHLILEPKKSSLQASVHAFAFRYAQYFNFRTKRRGHVYQGRFRSICVEDGVYFKRLVRYVHLNPVHSGVVQDPLEYLWSSHRAYLGLQEYAWLQQDEVLSRFGESRQKAIEALTEFIHRKVDGENDAREITQAFHIGVFGGENLIKQALKLSRDPSTSMTVNCSLDLAVEFVCNHCEISLTELASSSRQKHLVDARSILAIATRKTMNWNFEDLGLRLMRDGSSLSRLSSRENTRLDLLNLVNLIEAL